MNIHNTHVQTTTLMSTLSNHFDLKKIRLIKCTAIVPVQGSGATCAKSLYYTETPYGQVQLGREKIVAGVLSSSGATGAGTLNILATANSGDLGSTAALAASELVNDTSMTNATAALCTVHSTLAVNATASAQGYLSLKVDGEIIGTSGKANLTLITLSN